MVVSSLPFQVDPRVFIEGVEEVWADPGRWSGIIEFNKQAIEIVKATPVPPRPTWDDALRLVAVLIKFTRLALEKVAGAEPYEVEAAAGFLEGYIPNDREVLAAIPRLYAQVRMEILGLTPVTLG